MSQRLPIFHEDFDFHNNPSRMFDEMRRNMDHGLPRRPFSDPNRGFGDDFDKMCGDFFKLRPRDPLAHVRKSDDVTGSRESLDDGSLKSLFVEDPETKSRTFQMSFDVKDYDPQDIAVKMHEDTLTVEAKHEKLQDGNTLVTEFNRKIKIPKEVDPEKLTSSLSSDGILTLSAPVPPKYQSVTDGGLSTSERNSPSLAQHQDRCSPLLSQLNGRSLSSPTQSSTGCKSSPPPSTGTNIPTTPIYRKQIYMVPQSVIQNGAPITVKTTIPPNRDRPKTPPLDTPTFYNTDKGCELVLIMDIGTPYTPEDLLVKVDGRNLIVEAEHVEQADGKKSKSSFSREFELSEQVDPNSVTALLKEGRLKISGLAKQ